MDYAFDTTYYCVTWMGNIYKVILKEYIINKDGKKEYIFIDKDLCKHIVGKERQTLIYINKKEAKRKATQIITDLKAQEKIGYIKIYKKNIKEYGITIEDLFF